jgi:transposase-like protein
MGEANTKKRRAKAVAIAHKNDTTTLRNFLVKEGQLLFPFVDLITQSRLAVDEIIDMAGQAAIEALLQISAEQVAGPKRQGRRGSGLVGWHGSQRGRINLAERKLQVNRPRLRERGRGGQEVEIPAYEAMQRNSRLGERMLEILTAGVSNRKYERVLPEMAETVGVKKSSVSRRFIEESAQELKKLMERRFDALDILVIYIDGIVMASHHVIAAVGVDAAGQKHVLGVVEGASENTAVVKSLLKGLVERGVKPERRRLFVIDGSKALRSAITEIFGVDASVQRCRAHKIRNVSEHLPDELKEQVKAVMRAAYKLPHKEGIARLKKQAEWLEKQYPTAAASLLEGLEETFTVNKLGLTPALMRCLSTTNIIENPNSASRRVTQRVTRWRDGSMVLRWAAASFLEAEKNFRRITGWKELWVLKVALDDASLNNILDLEEASA